MSEVVDVPVDAPVVDAPVAEVVTESTVNFSELINSDGSFKEDFYSALPDDLGSHSSVQQMKNITDLTKSYQNTKGLIGKKLEEFWTSEDPAVASKRKEVMGIPDSVDGYDFGIPEIPEHIPYSEEMLGEFKGVAAELGLTKDQAEKLAQWDTERAIKAYDGMSEQVQNTRDTGISELKKEWGKDFEYNDAKVTQAADYLGIRDMLVETGMAYDPRIQKAILEKIVPAISNDKLVESSQQDNLATLSDSLNDVENAMHNYAGSTRDADYVSLVKKRSELLQRLS